MVEQWAILVALSITALLSRLVVGEAPLFRILAPQFICPKDENTPVDAPDNTVITIQTAAGSNFAVRWTVRWVPTVPLSAPTQRFTLMLWKAVRHLEAKLNGPQVEPYVYIIENAELLHGVNYIFNVTSVDANGAQGTLKSFRIDNTQGVQKLDEVDGRADLLSIVLVGSQVAYSDMEFVLEAQITVCYPTQDYHFLWTVRSTNTNDAVDVSEMRGSRLEVRPLSLKADLIYDVNCQVIKSNGHLITQTGLPFEVLRRGLEVYLNVDHLMVTTYQALTIVCTVVNHDYYDQEISYKWECKYKGEDCDFFRTSDKDTLEFSSGLPEIGLYEVTISVTILDQSASAKTTLEAVQPTLPVIQITPILRILNEGSTVSLVANASNVAPTCSLTWYFATEVYTAENAAVNGTCEDCEHGEAITDTLTIFSLEENFLNELTDFTNETEWRQVTAVIQALAGRARFVAHCGCSLTFECETKGLVYADVSFKLNESPTPNDVMVSPVTGSALETVFRISTLAALDPETPLRYSFFCNVGNGTLLLGSFVEHLAVETFLPFVDGGTQVWVEVCDALGACATGEPKTMMLSPGVGATVDALVEEARGHVRRCELMHLQRDAISAVVSYTNAGQPDMLSRFTTALLEALLAASQCVEQHNEQYSALIHALSRAGVDISSIV